MRPAVWRSRSAHTRLLRLVTHFSAPSSTAPRADTARLVLDRPLHVSRKGAQAFTVCGVPPVLLCRHLGAGCWVPGERAAINKAHARPLRLR